MNKRSRIHTAIFILTVIGAALVGGLLLLRMRRATPSSSIQQRKLTTAQHADGVLRSGSLTIPVSIADTEAERNQGLSDTDSLPAQDGKLFVFQDVGTPGFWMKDMHYGLDFVWLDSNFKIVAINTNVAANTYPQIFYPPQPILYVLEVNAGFSTMHDLKVGDQFILN